jgi:hypothetical protein
VILSIIVATSSSSDEVDIHISLIRICLALLSIFSLQRISPVSIADHQIPYYIGDLEDIACFDLVQVGPVSFVPVVGQIAAGMTQNLNHFVDIGTGYDFSDPISSTFLVGIMTLIPP